MKKVTLVLTMLVVLMLCGIVNAWTPPAPVVNGINTSSDEALPFLSFDSKTLYFSRDDGGNYNIYQATRQGTSGPFTSVTEALDHGSTWHVYGPWVSPDNLRMYYHDEGDGWHLRMSTRASVGNPWTAGTAISGLGSFSNPHTPKLTQDELTIVFSAYNAPGGMGGYDTWIATRPDISSPFDNIANLSAINSTGHEIAPFLTPDGLALYFHSNRSGISQLFKATRQSLSDPFGNLEHLSFFDSAYGSMYPSLSADGSTLFFTRIMSPGGSGDVYSSQVPEPTALLLLGLGAFALKGKKR